MTFSTALPIGATGRQTMIPLVPSNWISRQRQLQFARDCVIRPRYLDALYKRLKS
jgi:hypothetical protein